jgi:hypothetical protein
VCVWASGSFLIGGKGFPHCVCVCVLENDGVDFTNADHDLLVGNSVNYPAGERPPFGESFVDAS